MLILNQAAIEQALPMSAAIQACKDALALYSAGQTVVPLRSNVPVADYDGQSLFMPGYVSGEEPALGIKIVSVYPANADKNLPAVPASMLVLDPETGIVSAMLDGTYLTQLRTGAVQGAATDLLSRQDAKVAALIGGGGQALMQLSAMLNVRALEEVRIFDLDRDRCQAFIDRAQQTLGKVHKVRLIGTASAADAVKEADIITSVTTSTTPTFDVAHVKKGAHINGMGAFTPEMCEIPPECVAAADRIVFDTMHGVLAEAGDFIQPLSKGLVSERDYHGELGQVVNGAVAGRQHADEITLFKSVGSAVLDVLTAQRVVSAAKAAGLGEQVEL